MGNIRKVSVEAMKAVKNAKQAPTISEETVNEIKEAHRRFMQRNNSKRTWGDTGSQGQTRNAERLTYYYIKRRQHSRLSGKKLVAWLYVSLVAILLIIAGVGFWRKADSHTEEAVIKSKTADIPPSAHARPSESYDLKRYHNSRFGFNIAYPASFSTTQESTNGDGAILMRDEDTYLRAYGEDNYWDETLKERFESKKADYPSVVYSRLKNNWFVISGYLEDGRIFYHKTVQKGDSFVTAILCFRSGEKEYFSPIITEIFGKFPK